MGKSRDFAVWSVRLSDAVTIRRNVSILSDIEPTNLIKLANKEIHILKLLLILADFCAGSDIHGADILRAVLSDYQLEHFKLQLTAAKQGADRAFVEEIDYWIDSL